MASVLERELIIRLLSDTPLPVIVDLGAYIGDEFDWLRGIFDMGHYVGVEADPRNVARFRDRHPGAIVIEAAVAALDGLVTFHQCDNAVGQGIGSGSIRPPKKHLEFFPWCKFEKTIQVQGYTLDTLCGSYPPIDLLWVDVQGAERDMIAGGTKTLARTRYMMIEAEEHEFYEGQAVRPDLLAMLPDWEVVQEFDFNVFLKNRAQNPLSTTHRLKAGSL